jgi:hypothetical protein
MKTRKTSTIGLMILCMSLPALAVDNKAPAPYMGQEPPGLTPKIFYPGFISHPVRYEHDICFSKDGRECYFTIRNAKWTFHEIMVTRYENGRWTRPIQASFSDFASLSPSLADDDKSMYFSRSGGLWKAQRTITKSGTKLPWSQPKPMSEPISPSHGEWGCHISDLGNLWFCSWRQGGRGRCDLWFARSTDKQFKETVNFRDLNTSEFDCGPMPGPNENYFIWSSDRPGGFGKSDLYISFADGKGGWTAPINLGPTINTSGGEGGSYISPDNKYLFFNRCNTSKGGTENEDIYWVSVDAFLNDADKPASDKHN